MPVPGSDLDLRLVGYFTVVAEHENFGRAAAALHLAQPSLSRQIRRLEEHLGVRLLDRTPQGSSLTAAGRAFLPRAQELLAGAQRATAAAREAGGPQELTIGYADSVVITPAVRLLRHRRPGALIRTRALPFNDGRALIERRVDAVVARGPLPFPTEHLRVTELYTEGRVAVLPADHRLAGKESITVGDLDDEPFTGCPSAVAEWVRFARLGERSDVVDAPTGYESYSDKLEMVASGEAVLIVAASDHRPALHPHLVTVPIADAEAASVVTASRAADTNPLLDDFLASAAATLRPPVAA